MYINALVMRLNLKTYEKWHPPFSWESLQMMIFPANARDTYYVKLLQQFQGNIKI